MSDPTILIAGRRWRVPLFAPRQNRIVVPALLEPGTDAGERYDRLLDIAFAALSRGQPEIVRDDFDDWPIATHELLEAIPVIARQTGLLKKDTGPVKLPRPDVPQDSLPDWDAIIAEVVNFLPGTTPDYWEDALTIPRLEALREQWRLHPPPALLLAAYLDYRPPSRARDAIAELLRLFPAGTLKLN